MEAVATCSISAAPKALADHLAAVKPAVGTRSAAQALSGVRICLSISPPCEAFLEATDREVAVRRSILRDLHSCTIGGVMDVLVSHADLSKAVKLFAKRDVVSIVDEGGDDVAVTDGKRTITLRKLRAQDWPAFPAGDEGMLLKTDARELAPLIERAAKFASKDETRPILTGIAIVHAEPHPHDRGVRLWATDSYRLADIAVPNVAAVRPARTDGELSLVNTPARGLVMAAKAMRKSPAVALTTTHSHTFAHFGDEVWAIRRLDGQFPAFRQLVPDTAEVTVTMPKAELLGACDVAAAFSRKNAPMRLAVNGTVKVTGSTPDECSFEELLPGASYVDHGTYMGANDGELTIGLNPEFVADIAKVYAADEVTVRLITPLRPVLFIDGDDLYLQMPIRLNI